MRLSKGLSTLGDKVDKLTEVAKNGIRATRNYTIAIIGVVAAWSLYDSASIAFIATVVLLYVVANRAAFLAWSLLILCVTSYIISDDNGILGISIVAILCSIVYAVFWIILSITDVAGKGVGEATRVVVEIIKVLFLSKSDAKKLANDLRLNEDIKRNLAEENYENIDLGLTRPVAFREKGHTYVGLLGNNNELLCGEVEYDDIERSFDKELDTGKIVIL